MNLAGAIPWKVGFAAAAIAVATALQSLPRAGSAPASGVAAGTPTKAPKSFILKAGTLYVGDGAPQRNMAVVVRDGRVEFVRSADAELPGDLPMIDRSDAVVVPGFVVAESGLSDAFEERNRGLTFGTIVVFRTVDPTRRAIDGFSFVDRREAILASGVTTAYLAPGRARLVNGRGAVVKMAGGDIKDRTVRDPSDLSLSIGEAAENPPNYFDAPLPPSAENPIETGKPQMPRSRASGVYAIREAFEAAVAHAKSLRDAADPARRPPFDGEKAALAELLRSKTPVRIRATADVDVSAALALLKEYGLTGAIVGAREADKLAPQLKDAGIGAIVEIPVVGGVPADTPPRAQRPRDAAKTAAALAAAGVTVAVVPADDALITNIPLLLASAVRGGMSREAAVRAVSADSAKILGVSDRVGVLAPGRDADFLVLTGEPGDPSASVRETWSGGALVFDRAAGERARREAKNLPEARASVVVRAGWVYPMSGPPIRDGAVSIHDGKIIGVGRDVAVPRGARVIDAGPSAVITPGLIDGRSFLGLEGDATPLGAAHDLRYLAVPNNPDFRLAAAGGVTTALVQGVLYQGGGTPIAALKTGGSWRDVVLRESCGLGIPTQGFNLDGYRAILRRGKDYTDRWDKYFIEVDKQKEDAKKAAADGKKAEDKPEPKKDEKKEEAPAPSADPVTGTWEGELRGGPLPRPEAFTIKMRLHGDTITGTFSSRSPLARGQDIDFTDAKFKDNVITITITRPDIPFPIKFEGRIDKPDHMTGTVNAGGIQLDFEATRTEKAAPTLAAAPKGKKKGPEMPPVDEALEPFRRIFKGDGALVVRADTKNDIEGAIAVCVDEFKIPLVILGGAEADGVAPLMAAKKVALLSGPNLAMSRSDSNLPLIAEVAAAGAPVVLGTEAGNGSSHISEVGEAVVSRGVGADTVLRAFTLDAARAFRLDPRIGSLEPGKDGDLVVWSAAPFQADSRVKWVVVGGEVVAGESDSEAK